MKKLLTALMFMSVAPAVLAEDVTSTPDERIGLEITIYNGNLAQIWDSRWVDLASGQNRLYLNEVSPQIIAQTAKIEAGDLRIIEMNFDYDLLTPAKLLEKAVGSTVRIYRPNPGEVSDLVEEAMVLSANNGVVLQFADRIEILQADGLPGRIVFDGIPENLRARPTLSSTYELASDYQGAMDLTYLTRGLGWSTDYVATYDEDEGTIDLIAWVTLANSSGVSFENASLKLVAGSPGDAYPTQVNYPAPEYEQVVVTGSRIRTRLEQIAEYHLYTIPFVVDILNNQTKQVELFVAEDVTVEKHYWATDSYVPGEGRQNVSWGLSFENDEESGLGFPLPAGVFGVYQNDSEGRGQFVGSSEIAGTPVGQDVEIVLGQSFDVTYLGQVISSNEIGENLFEIVAEVTFSNARNGLVTVDYSFNPRYEWELLDSSISPTQVWINRMHFEVEIPAKGETVLSMTYRVQR